jgi:hypothetical protein
LSAWGSPDRLLAITNVAERRSGSEDLVTEIAEALAVAGEYVARIDVQPTQRVVDFTWVARQAGRRLGIRVDVDVKVTKAALDGKVEARVTPVVPPD